MAAGCLPLELQQDIFSLLDSRSFHAARCVCKWWRYASLNYTTLSIQLQKLPIRPAIDTIAASPQKLHTLINQAAHRLMFGLHVTREQEVFGSLQSAWKLPVRPKMAASSDGTKMVTVYDRAVTLFDVSGSQPIPLLQRQLNGLRANISHKQDCPWVRVTALSHHELALSSDGRLLVVALDQTIQIYDLSEDGEIEPVNGYLKQARGDCISAIEFEQKDYMLRVCLSAHGAVLYLGSPDSGGTATADISHWRSELGLNHTFLNSVLLTVNSGGPSTTQFSGIQLLRQFKNGYLFGAQKHRGGASSRYVLGHIRCSTNPRFLAPTAEHASITELASLESFLSSCDYALNELADTGMGGWDNMPCAHEHHPRFALSGDLLVVAERDKKSVRPMPHWTQLFLYRVPSEHRMSRMLEKFAPLKAEEPGLFTSQQQIWSADEVEVVGEPEQRVARIPLCLGSFPGALKLVELAKTTYDKQPAHNLKITTEETTKVWNLRDM